MNIRWIVAWLMVTSTLPVLAVEIRLSDDQSSAILTDILVDGQKKHEAPPLGVPQGFDWAAGPRAGAGNDSKGFQAATGWGQIFYNAFSNGSGATSIQVRRMQTFLCQQSGNAYQWTLTQRGPIEGRQFRADFAANKNMPALRFDQNASGSDISFERGMAFHFWPQSGRLALPGQNLCGILVLLQARQNPKEAGTLLIGLGADYWTTTSAPWDNYKTNKDLGIGRLRLVNSDWKWYGMTTASETALRVLIQRGYTDAMP